MDIIITGRKVNLKDNFKERVNKKLSKFAKMFAKNAEANVTVTLEKNRQTVEVTIRNNGMFYRAESTELEMNDALDKVIDKLFRQIRKNKTRLEKRLKTDSLDSYILNDVDKNESVENEELYDVVRNKHFPVKPLDVEEAILQMNMIGHQFYMFKNVQTGEINVVYRRKNDTYGLLEPEIN